MSKGAREIRTTGAPEPVGPYSQALAWGGLVFLSGQIPIDPRSGEMVSGEIEEQARQVLANLKAVLEAAGSSMSQVLKTTVYLTDLSLFPRVNGVYAEHFDSDPSPARATVEVSALPLGAGIEIDAIARVE